MISNITRFKKKIELFPIKWVHGLIDQHSIFVPCLLLAMRCCFIPFVRDLNGKKHCPVETSTGAESLHRDSFQRGFQDRKETISKNISQQKWNALKNHPKICSITDPFEQNTELKYSWNHHQGTLESRLCWPFASLHLGSIPCRPSAAQSCGSTFRLDLRHQVEMIVEEAEHVQPRNQFFSDLYRSF